MNLKKELLSNAVRLGFNDGSFSFDNRQLFNSAKTEVLAHVASALWLKIKDLKPTVLYGKGVAAHPLLVAIKLHAYQLEGVELAVLFIRDQRKQTGEYRKLIEGPMPQRLSGANAVFIDDLYNSGATHENAKQALSEEGYALVHVGAAVMVDFWQGSRRLGAVGFPFHCLVTRQELGLTREDAGLPTLLGSPRWSIPEHHSGVDAMPIKSAPTICDNRVFIGNDNTAQYCYDLDSGAVLWVRHSAQPALKGNVCRSQIAQDKVYWSSYDGVLRCAHAQTGSNVWATKLDSYLHSSPHLDQANDRLFIGTEWHDRVNSVGRGDIVCVQMSSGSELWRVPTMSMVPCSPTYSADNGLVVCASNDLHAYFLDAASGEVKLKLPTLGEVKGKPTFSEDGLVVVLSSNHGEVYCVCAKTLAVLWQRRIAEKSIHLCPIVEDGKVFLVNSAGYAMALSIDTGEVLWVTRLRGDIGWSIISTNTCLVVGTTRGYIVTLDKAQGTKLTSDQLPGACIYNPMAYDHQTNSLVVSTTKGLSCYSVKL
jgi:outer membrane protein assembly factor BamB/pyrimidine operon attenuation protein/uracil phosphoribosyltransferase